MAAKRWLLLDALGAGVRAFKSPRPDQRKQLMYLQMPGFGSASAIKSSRDKRCARLNS
jgi:hypothetical protein